MKLSDRMVDAGVSTLQAEVRDLFPDTKADWLDHMFAPPIRRAIEGVLLQARLEWEREHPSARQSEALAWALDWIKETGEVPIAEETEAYAEHLSAVEVLKATPEESAAPASLIRADGVKLCEIATFLDGLAETHASRFASYLRELSRQRCSFPTENQPKGCGGSGEVRTKPPEGHIGSKYPGPGCSHPDCPVGEKR